MRVITETVYIAEDGKRFADEQSCLNHEVKKRTIDEIFKDIPQWPAKHGSFLTVPKTILFKARRAIWQLVLEEYGRAYPAWRTWDADEVNPGSVVGRVLSDGAGGPIENAWNIMQAWDFELGRIYDQPYFVSHPQEAVCLE